MVGFIIGLVVMGLIVGALARLLVPGPDPMSVGGTILLGAVGSIIAGVIGYALFDNYGGGFLLSLIVTVGLVLLMRRTRHSTTRV